MASTSGLSRGKRLVLLSLHHTSIESDDNVSDDHPPDTVRNTINNVDHTYNTCTQTHSDTIDYQIQGPSIRKTDRKDLHYEYEHMIHYDTDSDDSVKLSDSDTSEGTLDTQIQSAPVRDIYTIPNEIINDVVELERTLGIYDGAQLLVDHEEEITDSDKAVGATPDDVRANLSDDLDDSFVDPDWIPSDSHDSEDNDNVLSNEDISDEEVIEGDNEPTAKRTKASQNRSVCDKNKRLRMTGQPYKGLCKDENGKYTFNKERPERKLNPRWCTNSCKKIKNLHCSAFSDEDRQTVFDAFWCHLSWGQRQVFVTSLVDKKQINDNPGSRKQHTYQYHLKKDGVRIRVCKHMFLATLAIGEQSVYAWLDQEVIGGIPSGSPEQREKAKPRGRSTTQVEEDLDKRVYAKEFLKSLPQVPSHYCRATSSKQYLEPVFTSFLDLHRVYTESCLATQHHALSRRTFKVIFDELNLSLYQPKKDQCDTCCGYTTGNVPEAEYNTHIMRKNAARQEKENDKARTQADTSNTSKMITVDLQSLLLCPRLNASAIYYKCKLACHNYTIYDMTTKEVVNYFWNECEGDLSASSFTSCLTDYIEHLDPEIETLIIYSDGCTYQNRNVVLSNSLLRVAKKHNLTIVHNYLEKGHTQMEVDSVHSVIERSIRKKEVYVPQNYVDSIKTARKAQPYEVKYLTHDFFGDYTPLNYYTSIRPGVRVGDAVVTDLRILKYTPEGDIQYKLNYGDDFQDLPRRARSSHPASDKTIGKLHQSRLPIKATKFKHLQDLKSVIPADYHSFYDALPKIK